jgi:bilirubin oxidase
MKHLAFLLIFLSTHIFAQIQNEINIPTLLSGNVIPLNMHMGTRSFFEGPLSQTYGINQYDYLGPTIELTQGQMVQMQVMNNLDDTTNLHWHGLQVPAMDDGPMTMMMMMDTWNPEFEVINRAGTYWYHPHVHKNTAMQALKGAVGMIIVRDNVESTFDLPRTYGVDDFPIIVQSIQYDTLNQVMPRGMNDSTIFVNGVRGNYGYEATLHVPANWVRLRVLNGSGERTFNVGLNNNQNFVVIASDNGLLSQGVNTNRIRISPGERYEILVDLTILNGSELSLWNWGTELPMGVQGGPTMPMPAGSPDMSSPLNGADFALLRLMVGAPLANGLMSVSNVFEPVSTLDPNAVDQQRVIVMSAENQMNMDGPFFFNNLTFDMDRIDYTIPLNSTETWILQNQTMVAHPFHMHDVAFQVVSRDGNLPTPIERGWKDVVLIHPQETVVIIAKFDVYSDSLTPYVYHCHILMHEDDGMMGQFVVVDPATDVTELSSVSTVKIFPNPTSDWMQIQTEEKIEQIQIWSAKGERVLSKKLNPMEPIDVRHLSAGNYVILLRTQDKTFARRFTKQ